MNMDKVSKIESKEREVYEYDVVVILGGGIQNIITNEESKYFPTNYNLTNARGGGGMRVAASLELYLQKKAKRFIFSGGRGPKTLEKYGEAVPTEAHVYSDKFTRIIEGLKKRPDYVSRFKDLEEPIVEIEDVSANTFQNLENTFGEIKNLNFKRIAIVTSDHHIPRTQALLDDLKKEFDLRDIEVTFISAEKFMQDSQPGKYDQIIKDVYEHPLMEDRFKKEAQGIEDLKSGKYKKL